MPSLNPSATAGRTGPGGPKGGMLLYFRDPAGNSLELVTRDLWELPSGR